MPKKIYDPCKTSACRIQSCLRGKIIDCITFYIRPEKIKISLFLQFRKQLSRRQVSRGSRGYAPVLSKVERIKLVLRRNWHRQKTGTTEKVNKWWKLIRRKELRELQTTHNRSRASRCRNAVGSDAILARSRLSSSPPASPASSRSRFTTCALLSPSRQCQKLLPKNKRHGIRPKSERSPC